MNGQRPTHARWAAFLDRELTLLDAAFEADHAMASYTGVSGWDERGLMRLYASVASRFASKFEVSLRTALDTLIDVYGFQFASRYAGLHGYVPDRLVAWTMEQPFDEAAFDAAMASVEGAP